MIKLEADIDDVIAELKIYEGIYRSFTEEPLRRNSWLSVLLTILNATTFMMILTTMVVFTF